MAVPVAYNLTELAALSPGNAAVTLGVFDGVHRGHRTIIDTLLECRERPDIDSLLLFTFDPHPVSVTHSREAPPILSTIAERLEILSELPLDAIFVVKFDEAMARMPYKRFIEEYLLGAAGVRQLILGYDCHFGYRRKGSPERVAAEAPHMGFSVTVVPPLEDTGQIISSTEIRKLIQVGPIEDANALLGHPYVIKGRVVQGQGKGRDLGFPTANLDIDDPLKLWPRDGVYAVRVRWMDRMFRGMMNIGNAPTIKGGKREMEVHIFDFDYSIYGETLTIYCETFLREEKTFATIHDLIEQLTADGQAAREALKTAY